MRSHTFSKEEEKNSKEEKSTYIVMYLDSKKCYEYLHSASLLETKYIFLYQINKPKQKYL